MGGLGGTCACTARWFLILKMRGIMDFLLVFLISPKLVGTTYKTEQREYLKNTPSISKCGVILAFLDS